MESRLTEAEALEEVARWANAIPEREPGMVLSREIAEVLGLHQKTLLPMLRQWIREGKLLPCRVPYVDTAGRRTNTFGYRIVG